MFEHLSIFATFYPIFCLYFTVVFGVAAEITVVIDADHQLQSRLIARFWQYHGLEIDASCSMSKVSQDSVMCSVGF